MTVPDPRDAAYADDQLIGTKLRDAAVDPRPTDFLGPTNAGVVGEGGNPHGNHVVNPQIRDSRNPIPGTVGTPAQQETAAYADLNARLPSTVTQPLE